MTATPLSTYLNRLFALHAGGWATTERSYYPALSELFNSLGGALVPKVAAIAEVAERGAGHPDFVLEVETTHDPRAAVEVKGTGAALADILRSEQVRRYLSFHDPVLVTNLREFVLARRGANGQAEEIMRYGLAETEAAFWQASPEALARQHGAGLTDFLTNVLTWDAMIGRPKDLAEALARYAREALRRLASQPAASLDPLRRALSEALGLHFTDEQGEHFFRSSLVQTLFYGLFSAWAVWSRTNPNADPAGFRWREAGDSLSLPVMRELFEHIAIPSQLEALDIRKPLEWAEATLRRCSWERFANAFGEGDAVNYFYEPFLEAYDPALREQLGVWYTPREIITYQVARVDRLLRDELHIPAGLADERVVVLDPATGTGGYLLEVLRVINRTLEERGEGAMRGMELQKAATRRVFGFEILPAPFVVAHLQIATLLADLGASLTGKARAGVYLTNALTGWKKQEYTQSSLEGWPALKQEVESSADVKQKEQILVILGNPPYRAQAGVAEDEERDLLAPYYEGLSRFGVQARGINDLYVRFFRLAERQIAEATGRGIVSYISNYNWLSGLSFPIMREHLLNAFHAIWIDNLHGDRIISERTPNGNSCETIFSVRGQNAGIKVGTAITTLVRNENAANAHSQVYYRDVWGMPDDPATWGRAERKRASLLWSSTLGDDELSSLYQTIRPITATRLTMAPGGTESAYLMWPTIAEVFPTYYPGVKTARDENLIAYDQKTLDTNMRMYYDSRLSNEDIARVMPRLMESGARYNAPITRSQLLKDGFKPENIRRYYYRPLDLRYVYWEGTTKLLDEKRADFFAQVFDGNMFLEARQRQPKADFDRTMVTPFLADNAGNGLSSFFPVLVRDRVAGTTHISPNINPGLAATLRQQWAIDDDWMITEALFYHTVATTQATQYRTENATYLYRDWPRIPIPASRDLLEASAALGRRVADLLRPDVPFDPPAETRALAVPTRADGGQLAEDDLTVTVRYGGIGRYEPPTGTSPARLWWNDTAYWQNVPPEVWAFTIGGYPVLKKWLDYRHIEKLKRPLRLEEVRYVSEMARRIATLLALGPALDASYEAVKAEAAAAVAAAVTVQG